MEYYKIDVDTEVFQFLQREARPFVDTPNDVLRRLLLNRAENVRKEGAPTPPPLAIASPTISSTVIALNLDSFLREVLVSRFGPGFKRRPPYRMMFEDADSVVYFQNFSKETDHLWYRVTAKPWKDLRASRKSAWICFTNPVEGYAYVLPVADIMERVHKSGWSRNFLEVNLDPATSRWHELNWDVSDYRTPLGRTR